jgi:hypothetical protein
VLPKPGTSAAVIATQLGDFARAVPDNSRDANAYVALVHRLEWMLQEYFSDVPLERLYTDRFWRINAGEGLRPEEMLRQESDALLFWLTDLVNAVNKVRSRFTSAAAVAVLDTHVLLHYKPLAEVDWPAVIGAKAVRLVVPLRVIDELDEKKAARRPELARRADTRVKLLAGYLTGQGPREVRPGIPIDAFSPADFDPTLYRRAALPPDGEILDTCHALTTFAGDNAVYLVTGDLGMKIRAESRNLPFKEMPEGDFQRLGEGSAE